MKLNLHDYPKLKNNDDLRKFYITIESDEFVKAFPYPAEYVSRECYSRVSEPALRMAESFIANMTSNNSGIPEGYLDSFTPPYRVSKAARAIVDSHNETVAYIDTAIVKTNPDGHIQIEVVDFNASYNQDEGRWEIRYIFDKEYVKFVDDTENIDDILDAMVKGIGFNVS